MDFIKIKLPIITKKKILALGSDSKAGFCIVKNGTAYLYNTPFNLYGVKKLALFRRKIFNALRDTKTKPDIIACDLHPYYNSALLADVIETNRVSKVQHHEAHITSCAVDNGLKGKFIGVAFDGTGFGLDGNIWGGEFFTGGVGNLSRQAHLRYAPMPGGDACVKEPWRMGLSYLNEASGRELKKLKLHFLSSKGEDKIELLRQAMNKRINSPLTSSMGRLFDGISAITGLCEHTGYEGEAAVVLEKAIKTTAENIRRQEKYKFDYIDTGGLVEIDWTPVIKSVVRDLKRKKTAGEISKKFHDAVCYMMVDVCVSLRKRHKTSRVCLSGGVFQNNYITQNVKPLLEKKGCEVFFHKKVPAHDGGISLGQAVMSL